VYPDHDRPIILKSPYLPARADGWRTASRTQPSAVRRRWLGWSRSHRERSLDPPPSHPWVGWNHDQARTWPEPDVLRHRRTAARQRAAVARALRAQPRPRGLPAGRLLTDPNLICQASGSSYQTEQAAQEMAAPPTATDAQPTAPLAAPPPTPAMAPSPVAD